jgi:hypothetical protein
MIEYMDFKAPWRSKGDYTRTRKHNRGDRPCHGCIDGKHERCRPHLIDNRYCTCSCPRAVEIRAQGAVLAAERPDLSEQKQVKELDRLGYLPTTRSAAFGNGGDILYIVPRTNRQDVPEDES